MFGEAQGQAPAVLIGLDWGTSSLRSYRLDAEGQVQATRQLPWGVMKLPARDGRRGGFEIAFDAACGDWVAAQPDVPVVACGMVGSAQGWREAPYVTLPCGLTDLARSLTLVESAEGEALHIVPGLMQPGQLPNVMRGEETQVLGVLDALAPKDGETILVGLPGTHTKWVSVQDNRFLHFETFMTGEVFGLLRDYSILGRTMEAGSAKDDDAFVRGLAVARSDESRLGVLSNIFSCRTLGLTNALSAASQADYLSGVLIGHEVAALMRSGAAEAASRLVLVGEQDLCRRYADALELYGMDRPDTVEQATVRGLRRVALAAGLVKQ